MSRRPRPNLETVQAFSVFADTLNFSEAARHLHISQPALHAKIGRLATQLDVPLYRRDRRKLHLTPQGQLVARHGREMRAGVEAMLDELAGRAAVKRIVLAAGEGAFLYLLGPAIAAFKRSDARDARLTLMTADRDSAIEAVRAGKAQIGVAPLDAVPDDMKATPVTRVGQVLVVPKAHPLARRKSIKLSDLANADLIVPRAGQPHREMLARALESAGVPWHVAVEVAGWELMLQFARQGFGLAIVNDYCRLGQGLVAVRIPELPSLHFRLFHLRGMRPEGALTRLVADIVELGAAKPRTK